MTKLIPFPRQPEASAHNASTAFNRMREELHLRTTDPQIPIVADEAPLPAPALPSSVCPTCRGAGWLRLNVSWGDPRFGKPVPCTSCKNAETQAARIGRTYTWLDRWLGQRPDAVASLEGMTFETFRARANGASVAAAAHDALDYAKQLIGSMQPIGMRNAVLVSDTFGVGKTHLAAAILNEARRAGVPCLFCAGNDFFQAIYNANMDAAIIQAAIEVPLLCLDDLDKMQAKEDGSYQKSTLFTLFNERDLAKKPTILTANETEDWRKWVHGAVLSRLFGRAMVIEMAGQDYRLFGGTR